MFSIMILFHFFYFKIKKTLFLKKKKKYKQLCLTGTNIHVFKVIILCSFSLANELMYENNLSFEIPLLDAVH